MSIHIMFMIFTFLLLVVPTTGKSFLQQVDARAEMEASLTAEFAATFRPGAAKDNILQHEAALRPLYTAVPQEEDGTLHHTVVRYVLHRFFAQRGWFIRGLEPGTGAQNNSSGGDSLHALQEWVPAFLQKFLDQLVGGRGIGLRELAILAATLEDLVHKETISRLEKSFYVLNLPLSGQLEQEQISEILEIFMMLYTTGGSAPLLPDNAKRGDFQHARDYFMQNVDDWGEVQQWMRSVQQKIYPNSATLDFTAIGSVVEKIGATFATYNQKECTGLKAKLLAIESQKAGRVRLVDFYKKGLSGVAGFEDKIDYLRALGALDETDPKQPHVIVPNYIGARPNCMPVSHFYVVCCQNECEELIGKLENSIASEMAMPEQILPLVSALSSSTVAAPRTLSATLTQRLYSIAESNAGQVPLHGRLFAQWIHHAFPRECPFPHAHGSAKPQTPDEWMQESGHESSEASAEEMQAHVYRDTNQKPIGAEARKHHHLEENELPWSESEELFNGRRGPVQSQPQTPWSMCIRGVAFATAILSGLTALRSTANTKLAAVFQGDDKFFV